MHLISLHRTTRTFLSTNVPEASEEGSRGGLGRGVCACAVGGEGSEATNVIREADGLRTNPVQDEGSPAPSANMALAGHPELCSPKDQFF